MLGLLAMVDCDSRIISSGLTGSSFSAFGGGGEVIAAVVVVVVSDVVVGDVVVRDVEVAGSEGDWGADARSQNAGGWASVTESGEEGAGMRRGGWL